MGLIYFNGAYNCLCELDIYKPTAYTPFHKGIKVVVLMLQCKLLCDLCFYKTGRYTHQLVYMQVY